MLDLSPNLTQRMMRTALTISLLFLYAFAQSSLNDQACLSIGGQCTERCDESRNNFLSGRCGGGISRKCCVPKPTVTGSNNGASGNPTLNSNNVNRLVKFGPAAPLPTGAVTCKSMIGGYQGVCINVNDCSGATYNGLCPGSSKCCVPSSETTTFNPETVPKSLFMAVFSSLKPGPRADAMHAFMISAMAEAKISGCFCTAAFIAQVSHESGGLLYFEEIANGSAYEGRKDLGNTQPGDGARFKGRGPIQLTGRANYAAAGSALGLDLVGNPESVCFPGVGWRTTAWFWNKNGLNQFCKSGAYNDFVTLTKRINGGVNGLEDRVNKWNSARAKLGCA